MPLLILVGAAAGAAGFFGGATVASSEARDRVQYWLTVGAAAATLYMLWRSS